MPPTFPCTPPQQAAGVHAAVGGLVQAVGQQQGHARRAHAVSGRLRICLCLWSCISYACLPVSICNSAWPQLAAVFALVCPAACPCSGPHSAPACREINRGGLLLIYQILADTSQADIAKALQVG